MSDQKGPAVKLPWTRVLDQNSSCFYLFNTKTGESIWETPTIIQGINEGLTPTQAKRRADAAKAAGSSNGSASPAAAPPTTAATATTTTTTASSAPSTSAETLTEEDIALGIDARVEHTPLSDSEGEASPAGRPGGGLAIDTDADGVAELVARDMEAARSAPSRSFKGHRSSIAVTMMSRSGGAYVQPAASPSAAHLPAHLRSPPRTSGGGATGSPAVEVTNVAAGVTRTGSASPRSATSPPSAAGVGSGAAAGAGTGTGTGAGAGAGAGAAAGAGTGAGAGAGEGKKKKKGFFAAVKRAFGRKFGRKKKGGDYSPSGKGVGFGGATDIPGDGSPSSELPRHRRDLPRPPSILKTSKKGTTPKARTPGARGMGARRISFADAQGHALENVRYCDNLHYSKQPRKKRFWFF